jgi:hypothetical protein
MSYTFEYAEYLMLKHINDTIAAKAKSRKEKHTAVWGDKKVQSQKE